MPQMAPLSWLTLFFMFSLFIIMTSNKIWFSNPSIYSTTSSQTKTHNYKMNSYTWKW